MFHFHTQDRISLRQILRKLFLVASNLQPHGNGKVFCLKARFPWPAWFVMALRDSTEAVSCCLPRVPGSWWGVCQPKPFLNMTSAENSAALNENWEVDLWQPWSDHDPNYPVNGTSTIFTVAFSSPASNLEWEACHTRKTPRRQWGSNLHAIDCKSGVLPAEPSWHMTIQ